MTGEPAPSAYDIAGTRWVDATIVLLREANSVLTCGASREVCLEELNRPIYELLRRCECWTRDAIAARERVPPISGLRTLASAFDNLADFVAEDIEGAS